MFLSYLESNFEYVALFVESFICLEWGIIRFLCPLHKENVAFTGGMFD